MNDLDDDKKKKKKKRLSKRYQEVFRNDFPDFEEEQGAGHYAPAGDSYGRSLAVGKILKVTVGYLLLKKMTFML